MDKATLLLLHCLCLVVYSSAQNLLVQDVQGYTGKSVTLTCQVMGFAADILAISKVSGNISTHITQINSTEISLTISSAILSDGGNYQCSASTANNLQSVNAIFNLNVTTYVALHRQGPAGQRMISTENMLRVQCPAFGVPGPSEIFWQSGLSQTGPNVTNMTGEGPFVDSEGYLDLSTSTSLDEGSFRCTAVDIFGVTVKQTFYITIVRQPAIALWRQWYIILVYCVVGVFLVVVMVLCLWCCCIHCCINLENTTTTAKETKRPIQLFTRTALPEESGIEEYAEDYPEDDS